MCPNTLSLMQCGGLHQDGHQDAKSNMYVQQRTLQMSQVVHKNSPIGQLHHPTDVIAAGQVTSKLLVVDQGNRITLNRR